MLIICLFVFIVSDLPFSSVFIFIFLVGPFVVPTLSLPLCHYQYVITPLSVSALCALAA
jgi:hypothetical protein